MDEANKPLPDWRIISMSPTATDNKHKIIEIDNKTFAIDSTWVKVAQEAQQNWTKDNPYGNRSRKGLS